MLVDLPTPFSVGYSRETCWISFEKTLKFAIGDAIRRRGGCVGHGGSERWMHVAASDRAGVARQQQSAGMLGGSDDGIHKIHQMQRDGFDSGRSCR